MTVLKDPIVLLEEELSVLKRCLFKSNRLFEAEVLSTETHDLHVRNLVPVIAKYEIAIAALKQITNSDNNIN